MNLEELLPYLDVLVFARTQRHLKDVDLVILRGAWQGHNYGAIAEENGYTEKYLAQDVGPKLWKLLSDACGEKVSKTNFQAALERKYQQDDQQVQSGSPVRLPPTENPMNLETNRHTRYDVAQAIDVSCFYGRTAELAQLGDYILDRRCRVVALVGMGGIGKTTLTAKFVQSCAAQFDSVIWRSLRFSPTDRDLMTDLWQFLANVSESCQKNTVEQQITQLLKHLRQQRCLMVLDDWESLLQEGDLAGYCAPQNEGYSRFLTRMATEHHQSCLLLISREQPIEISSSVEPETPVHILKLRGLQLSDAESLLMARGFAQQEPGLIELIQVHRGNPAALKITATTIQELFDGNVLQFLTQSSLVLGDVLSHRLSEHYDRLTVLEKFVMDGLSIAGQPFPLSHLKFKVNHLSLSTSELLTALESLQRRSLLIRVTDPSLPTEHPVLFTLEPVVMKYVTQQIIAHVSETIYQAVMTQSVQMLGRLNHHPLFLEDGSDETHSVQRDALLSRIQNTLRLAVGRGNQQFQTNLQLLLPQFYGETPHDAKQSQANLLTILSHFLASQ